MQEWPTNARLALTRYLTMDIWQHTTHNTATYTIQHNGTHNGTHNTTQQTTLYL